MAKGLDSGTAFEILSIDIADVDVGTNIGAILQTNQAEADLKVARAKAEERRAAAVALEQEMNAEVAKMAQELLKRNRKFRKLWQMHLETVDLGVMDYYNMKNIQADTDMRNTIAKPEEKKKDN